MYLVVLIWIKIAIEVDVVAKKIISRKAITGLVMLLLAGCAGPWKYNQDYSRARNIVKAGSIIDGDLHDSKDGLTGAYGKPFLSQVMGALEVATIFSRPALGMGMLGTAAVNTIDIMAHPENPSGRPCLMAWMPKSLAADKNQARELLVVEYEKAIGAAAKEMDFVVERHPFKAGDTKIKGIPLVFWKVHAPKFGCTDWNCSIAAYAYHAYEQHTPEFLLDKIESSGWKFSAGVGSDYPRLIFRKQNGRNFPEKQFYATISKHLPIWVALYFPPNTIFQDGKPLTYPVVFEKGEILLFKRPTKK